MPPTFINPDSCDWLPASLPQFNRDACRIAHAEIGIEENEGANNSPRIREYLDCVGSPHGSSWCAGFAWWSVKHAGGILPPRDGGSVQKSREWAMANGVWHPKDFATPLPGWLTIYGEPEHAHHCGLLLRVFALGLRDVEGNTTWSGYGIDGGCVAMKPVQKSMLLGFIETRAA